MNIIDTLLYELYPWSYLIIGIGVMIENAGVPIPGEAIMIAAAILSASHKLDPCLVIISGTAGAVIGDNMGYWIGRLGGRKLVDFTLQKMRVPWIFNGVRSTERFFARHGGMTVFFARFITGVRIFAGPVAGVSLMNFGKFFLYNTLGAVIWANTIVLGIMYLGTVYAQYIRDYMDADIAIYGLLFVVLLWIISRVIKKLRRPKR